MRYSDADKARIAEHIHAGVLARAKILDVPAHQACVIYAWLGWKFFSACGEKALFQAGSASWRAIAPERDDGKNNTHFAYVWTAGAEKRSEFAECHAWVALATPAGWEIVDFSTRHLMRQAREITGIEWDASVLPPPFVWGEPPDGSSYIADAGATAFAIRRAVEMEAKFLLAVGATAE